jgi:phosphotransferase system HPr (HPr) family protein
MKTEKIVTVSENSYLLTNQAGQLVKAANSFRSKISIVYDEYRLNAKSLLGMLMLKVAVGDKITITAEGDDAVDAVEALAKLI